MLPWFYVPKFCDTATGVSEAASAPESTLPAVYCDTTAGISEEYSSVIVSVKQRQFVSTCITSNFIFRV